MNWTVPFADVRMGEEEKRAVQDVLDSNWLTMGPRTQAFEAAFAEAMGGGVRAVAVANCTAALHLAMLALDIGPGDEVICPALTFVATANAVRYVGAKPVFADVVSDTDWTVSPADIEARITPRTRAIIVMHYGGYPVEMDSVLAMARRHGLRVVEDACHGPLSEYAGRKLGTLGDVGCFSFFSNKNMTTGEGGMVTTADPALADRIAILRAHGMTASSFTRFQGHAFGYDVTELGYNYRIDEIRAAIGIEQLKKLPEYNRRRTRTTDWYRTALAERVPEVTVPFLTRRGTFAHHIFPILLPEGRDRQSVMEALKALGVQTSFHYLPVHWFSAFRDVAISLPITDAIAPRILSIPLFPAITDDQMAHVVAAIGTALADG